MFIGLDEGVPAMSDCSAGNSCSEFGDKWAPNFGRLTLFFDLSLPAFDGLAFIFVRSSEDEV